MVSDMKAPFCMFLFQWVSDYLFDRKNKSAKKLVITSWINCRELQFLVVQICKASQTIVDA